MFDGDESSEVRLGGARMHRHLTVFSFVFIPMGVQSFGAPTPPSPPREPSHFSGSLGPCVSAMGILYLLNVSPCLETIGHTFWEEGVGAPPSLFITG